MKKNLLKLFIVITLILICCGFIAADINTGTMPISKFPVSLPKHIAEKIESNKEFWTELESLLKNNNEEIFILADKKNPLPDDFIPKDLTVLKTKASYVLNKEGLKLTAEAEKALEKMAAAAKKDGITILVSSAYRSFEYQKKLFDRYSRKYGITKAETFSARPESTQHRLGYVVDFGSISDEYAETKAGKWLFKNAEKHGWSLSYPKGYENVTGYKWECWHYRYLGKDACAFQKKWFNNIQQYMLEFIHEYKKNKQH